MDTVAVSRRQHTNKKGNKENAQPECGSKSSLSEKTSATPFQLTNGKKEDSFVKTGALKVKVDTRSRSVGALKGAEQKDGKGAAVQRRQTHSRAFLTEQSVKHKKIVAEAPMPPAAAPPPPKPAAGMYKGKIVQSKIGSIWRSTATVGGADPKPSASTTEGQRVGNVTKSRSKSVADLTGYDTHKPVSQRSKSVLDQVTKPADTSRPAGLHSTRPPARTVPSTGAPTSSRNPKVAPTKEGRTQNSKPKVPVTDKTVEKPVSSALSQYRFTVETAEERRAKLSQWLASKGKALKRPAMTTAEPSKSNVSAKPEAGLNPQPQSRVQPAGQCNPDPEPRREAQKPETATAAHCADTQRAVLASETPVIMNTTLDLLESSDVEPLGSVDDIVVNLCDALEAMETPSRCDELSDVCSGVDMEDSKLMKEMPEDVGEQPKVEQVKDKEESEEQKVETDEEGGSDEECVIETTPQMEDASVIKYSVKTTPYLQSVNKKIKEDAGTSRSGRKGNIKELKFLTPVRRSCRIERRSSRLPAMLVDPDPCVSSLAELLTLDEDPNTYICRKNPALVQDLPDSKKLWEKNV